MIIYLWFEYLTLVIFRKQIINLAYVTFSVLYENVPVYLKIFVAPIALQ